MIKDYKEIIVSYEKAQEWDECAKYCVDIAKEYNTNKNLDQALLYFILAIYYNIIDELEVLWRKEIFKVKKGAKLLRRGKLGKALRKLDIIPKLRYSPEKIRRFGHIYDLLGNNFLTREHTSRAIEYYQKSRIYNHEIKNMDYVKRLDKKINKFNQ